MRYIPFKLPVSGQHGIVDRRRGRYLHGIICDDAETAGAIARLLNQEHRRWQGDQDAEQPPVRLRHDGRSFATLATGDAANDQPAEPPQPKAQRFRLADYTRAAPESERRLIAKLRAMPAAAD